MIRPATVAGRFYPADPRELERVVEDCLREPKISPRSAGAAAAEPASPKIRALACMVPHAGYLYSGKVAGSVFRRLKLPMRYIVLCPRHFPAGKPLAILSDGTWQTPLGEARMDGPLGAALKGACSLLKEDAVAHEREHSIEVQLPFLQAMLEEFTFVPIAIGTTVLAALEELGEAVARVVEAECEQVLVLATSDMNHYESDSITRVKDEKALEKILQLDPRGLYEVVQREDISMCGFGAAVAMLTAARRLGATSAELVTYATSGDVTGDRESVVGYAGIIVR